MIGSSSLTMLDGARVRLAIVDGEPTRPRTRGDCAAVPRPCPFATCRHSLLPELERAGIEAPANRSCVLDIVDEAETLTFDEIAALFGVTSERVRTIELKALFRVVKRGGAAYAEAAR